MKDVLLLKERKARSILLSRNADVQWHCVIAPSWMSSGGRKNHLRAGTGTAPSKRKKPRSLRMKEKETNLPASPPTPRSFPHHLDQCT